MNRVDFMEQLEILLRNIAPAEREEAIHYYNNYFDDAGPENEQEVIEALGSPARVAENIKRDLLDASGGENMAGKVKASDRVLVEYGKSGREKQDGQESGGGQETQEGTQMGQEAGSGQGTWDSRDTWGPYAGQEAGRTQPVSAQPIKDSRMPAWLIAVVVTVLILLSPAILGLLTSALGILIGAFVTWFSLIVGFGVATVALFVAFVTLLVTGTICLAANPWVGVALLGGGMLCGCVAILFLMLTVAMAGIVTPAIFRGTGRLFRCFTKKRTKA